MAVVVYSVNPYRALFDDGGGARFSFNGVDQYATMPGWAANGKPRQYWFNFNADAVATGTEQVIVSGVDGGIALEFYLHATLSTLSIRYRSATGTQAIEGVTGIDIVPGKDYVIHIINLGTGSEVYVNNILIDILAFEASAGIQPALTHMGAGHELARFFGGQLWSDRLVDDSPINDTYANIGDGVRHGELEQAIVLDGDLEIEWDGIVQAGISWVLTDAAGTSGIRVAQSNIQVFNNGTGGVIANTSLDVGQHYKGRFTVLSGVAAIYVDDLEVATGPQAISSWNLILVAGSAVQPMTAGQAFQNTIVRDIDNNLTWNYPLNEGSGTDIINTDPSTQGNYQNMPIYDTDALMGDGDRRIEIPQFTIPAGDDYYLSVDWIRRDATGTASGAANLFGIAGSTASRCYCLDSTHTIPSRVNLRPQTVSTIIWDGALDNVAQGEHINLEFIASAGGTSIELLLNGVSKGSRATAADNFSVGQIYAANSTVGVPANSAMQNVILENTTTGEAIGYKINEGSGLDVIAYDIVNGEFGAPVPAKNGTVTPNADWQYIPEYSNNGAWTPDTDWTFIPDNSRFYPMSGGSAGGATLVCRDGNNQLTPANDATIQNYTDNWERPS